ncbi:hypothetical protein ACPF7Z_08045 [Halomonas sp. GXIMD04776]|uniref:hypothetical protein n=1 Tax=Halomonas sp. GXIMD04776 TaxID=3415605 RepID=UPI003C85EB45
MFEEVALVKPCYYPMLAGRTLYWVFQERNKKKTVFLIFLLKFFLAHPYAAISPDPNAASSLHSGLSIALHHRHVLG